MVAILTSYEYSPKTRFCYNLIIKYFEVISMTAPIINAKNIFDSLPEDSSYDEILKELAFHRMIEYGLNDSKNGKTISNDEMKHRLKQW